ncbi:MAG: FlxA-like family protein [Bacillota bacterium]|nr:FlxA-like family protein [Bacillota bacterium]
MNISSVSSSTSSPYSPVNNTDDITQLEKQKANLEKELQKENQSKDDAKTKAQKVKQIQMEIQQIDTQIQQMKSGKSGQTQNAGKTQMLSSLTQAKPPEGMNNSAKISGSSKDNLTDNKIDVQV